MLFNCLFHQYHNDFKVIRGPILNLEYYRNPRLKQFQILMYRKL